MHLTVVRFAMRGRPGPPITETLTVTHLARRAAMAWYGRLQGGGASPTLSGRNNQGPLATNHQHAHYLATDEDGDGLLDRLTVWAPAGFTAPEIEALARIDGLRSAAAALAVEVCCLGCGVATDLPACLAGPSRTWRSITPFLLPRHPHWRGQAGAKRLLGGPEAQLRRELENRGLAEYLAEVVPAPAPRRPDRPVLWTEFRRSRPGSPPRVRAGFGFRLVFSQPVSGPIAVGYGGHFGLGLLTPDPWPGQETAGAP